MSLFGDAITRGVSHGLTVSIFKNYGILSTSARKLIADNAKRYRVFERGLDPAEVGVMKGLVELGFATEHYTWYFARYYFIRYDKCQNL